MKKVTIIDYGTGNILSLKRSLKYFGINPIITNSKKKIINASHLILPGVGAFKTGMQLLNKYGLPGTLRDYVKLKKPLLGICLGMQLLFNESNEFGDYRGLGLIEGKVRKISYSKLDVPIIGWYKIKTHGKFLKKYNKKHMYFVHSYQALPTKKNTIKGTYKIDKENITAAVQENNIYGLQFHPEKSSYDGLNIIKEFISL